MNNVNDKPAKPAPDDAPAEENSADGWNPHDEYDCRLDADTPKQTQAYIDETMPWRKDALAKRKADLKAASLVAAPPATSKKS